MTAKDCQQSLAPKGLEQQPVGVAVAQRLVDQHDQRFIGPDRCQVSRGPGDRGVVEPVAIAALGLRIKRGAVQDKEVILPVAEGVARGTKPAKIHPFAVVAAAVGDILERGADVLVVAHEIAERVADGLRFVLVKPEKPFGVRGVVLQGIDDQVARMDYEPYRQRQAVEVLDVLAVERHGARVDVNVGALHEDQRAVLALRLQRKIDRAPRRAAAGAGPPTPPGPGAGRIDDENCRLGAARFEPVMAARIGTNQLSAVAHQATGYALLTGVEAAVSIRIEPYTAFDSSRSVQRSRNKGKQHENEATASHGGTSDAAETERHGRGGNCRQAWACRNAFSRVPIVGKQPGARATFPTELRRHRLTSSPWHRCSRLLRGSTVIVEAAPPDRNGRPVRVTCPASKPLCPHCFGQFSSPGPRIARLSGPPPCEIIEFALHALRSAFLLCVSAANGLRSRTRQKSIRNRRQMWGQASSSALKWVSGSTHAKTNPAKPTHLPLFTRGPWHERRHRHQPEVGHQRRPEGPCPVLPT